MKNLNKLVSENTAFIYQDGGPSSTPDKLTTSELSNEEEAEAVALANAQKLSEKLWEMKGEDAQKFIYNELEPALEELKSEESVRAVMANLKNVFPDIIDIIKFKEFNNAESRIKELTGQFIDGIHNYLVNNPRNALPKDLWGDRPMTIKDRTDNVFNENIKKFIGTKESFVDAIKESFNSKDSESLSGSLNDQEISDLYDIIFTKGISENVKEYQELLVKADPELNKELEKNARDKAKKEGKEFKEGSQIDDQYGYATDGATIRFAMTIVKHTSKEVELNVPQLLEQPMFTEKPIMKTKEVPKPAFAQYKNVVSVKEKSIGSFGADDEEFMENDIEATEKFYESIEDDEELKNMMDETGIAYYNTDFEEMTFESIGGLDGMQITEFSFAGAFKGLRQLPDTPHKESKTNLVKIYTDEQIQGVSREGLMNMQSLAYQKNADIVWQIQMKDSDTGKITIHEIPLKSLVKYFHDSANNKEGKNESPYGVWKHLNRKGGVSGREKRELADGERLDRIGGENYYSVFVPEGYEGVQTKKYESADAFAENAKKEIIDYKDKLIAAKNEAENQYQEDLAVWQGQQPPTEEIYAYNKQQEELLAIGRITEEQYKIAYVDIAKYGLKE